MTISIHKATIGRKLWLWMNHLDGVKDATQAFSAEVVHVNRDGSVDVIAYTHTGAPMYVEALEVHDPATAEAPHDQQNHHDAVNLASPYCTWMPYQKATMDAGK